MARTRSAAPTRVAVIGAGRLAHALLPALGPAGYHVVAVAARASAAARAAARLAPGSRATTRPAAALEGVDLVLLAVPDQAILEVATALASIGDVDWRRLVVLHHAGAWGPELLEPLARRGAGTGVLHPLQCLGSAKLAPRVLAGSAARVEGLGRGLAAARRLARALGLVPLALHGGRTAQNRQDYHAAASLVANDLVALLDLGRELFRRAGIPDRVARRALANLARGTLLQYGEAGEAAAATGPVSRGDVATLRHHLERLTSLPHGAEIHRLLSLRLARVVRRHGQGAAATRVERALGRGRGPSSGL